MINPGEIPQIPGDMEALAGHATAISKVGGDFAGTGQRVNATWQGLAGVYRAPEAGQLFAATGPVQGVSATVGEDIEAVGAALSTYAAEVAEIKRQLASLQTQASSFVNSVSGDDEWREDEGKVNQHNGLINSVNAQIAALFEAQRKCANTINALYGGRQYRAENGDGRVEDGEYGFTADVLNAAAGEDGVLPWGSNEEHDRGFLGDVGAYFGSIGDSFMTMLGDLGSLIGRDPVTGQWSWSTAGTAWTGVGKFVYAAAIYSNPITAGIDQSVGMPGFDKQGAGSLLLDAGKTMIAYDQWGEDNARAAGTATFNIVSAVVGTKGAGASLRGAGTAANVARTATAAKVSAGLIRAGNFIDNLPSATQIATRISAKFNIQIPKFEFGPIPAFADGLPSGGHRFDVEMPGPRGPETFNMDAGNGPGSEFPDRSRDGDNEFTDNRDNRSDPLPENAPSTSDLPGSQQDGSVNTSHDAVDSPAGNTAPASRTDPFDELDSASRDRLIDDVISDSNEKFPMSRENAEAVLRGGPPGTTPRVAGEGVAGGDVQFVDADGNTVLARENKSIGGGYNSFNKEVKHAALDQLNGKGEVWVQVHPGTDVDSWVRKFQGSRPADRLADYAGVDVVFRDPDGNVLGSYNLGTRLGPRE